jgi:hypothetical protein
VAVRGVQVAQYCIVIHIDIYLLTLRPYFFLNILVEREGLSPFPLVNLCMLASVQAVSVQVAMHLVRFPVLKLFLAVMIIVCLFGAEGIIAQNK